jgi:hypothetical protein
LFPARALPFYLANLPAAFKARLGQPTSPDEARNPYRLFGARH